MKGHIPASGYEDVYAAMKVGSYFITAMRTKYWVDDEEEGYKLDQSVTENMSKEEEKSEEEVSAIHSEDESSPNQKHASGSMPSAPSSVDSFAENYPSKTQAEDSVQSPLSDTY